MATARAAHDHPTPSIKLAATKSGNEEPLSKETITPNSRPRRGDTTAELAHRRSDVIADMSRVCADERSPTSH
jgi:hypothetical protein